MLEFKPFYYIFKIDFIFNLHSGAIDSIAGYVPDSKSKSKGVGVVLNKNIYSHNFWTEIRGGRKIDTMAVFKSKYSKGGF